VAKRQFGVSTHLYHHQRLCRAHLLEIAAHGFETVEVFATRTHFDYHNPAAVADLQQWLAEAGLVLQSVHAPIAESYVGGRWSGTLSIASADPDARAHAVREAEQALYIARRIPVPVLVTHLGLPRGQRADTEVGSSGAGSDPRVRPTGDTRAAARRSVDELQEIAGPLGVRIAVEVQPNELSRAGSLVHFVEDDVERGGGPGGLDVGICLDFGHAHIDGDVVDAIETVSEHLVATHVHDNRGRADDHLMPFEGTIDWPAALTAVQKIGYEGPFMLEIAAAGSTKDTLARAQKAREKMERWLTST
jgi:sugar phosphate isomerase/epimerase